MRWIDTGALRLLAQCDGLNTQGDCDSPYPPEDSFVERSPRGRFWEHGMMEGGGRRGQSDCSHSHSNKQIVSVAISATNELVLILLLAAMATIQLLLILLLAGRPVDKVVWWVVLSKLSRPPERPLKGV